MRLQKASWSLSHTATINLVDSLGENFDTVVLEWKKVAEEKLDLKVMLDNSIVDLIMNINCAE